MKKKLFILLLVIILGLIVQPGRVLSIDNNINVYLTNNKYYKGELVEINDSSLIIYYITIDRSGNLMLPCSSISKIMISDEFINKLKTKISVYSKNYIKKNYQIKGIDFEKNVLYIDSVFPNPDYDIVHRRDSIDLGDTSIIKIVIDPKTEWGAGLLETSIYSAMTGAGSGIIIGGILASGSSDGIIYSILTGGAIGGTWGAILGIPLGLVYVISNMDNDINLKFSNNMKNTLLNYIQYPLINKIKTK